MRIGEMYTIEREIRGQSPQQCVAIRQASIAPLVATMQTWLRAQLNRVSSDSALAKASATACATGPGRSAS